MRGYQIPPPPPDMDDEPSGVRDESSFSESGISYSESENSDSGTSYSDNGQKSTKKVVIPPPPPDIDEPKPNRSSTDGIEALIEKQRSIPRTLYPEKGMDAMLPERKKQVHEDITPYIPRLTEAFKAAKDKNAFFKQLEAGHEFKKGTTEDLKLAIDKTIDFTAPREYNSYESNRAKEKAVVELYPKVKQRVLESGIKDIDKYITDIVNYDLKGKYGTTVKENQDIKNQLLDQAQYSIIESAAEKKANEYIRKKYGRTIEDIVDARGRIDADAEKIKSEVIAESKKEAESVSLTTYDEIAQYDNELQVRYNQLAVPITRAVESGEMPREEGVIALARLEKQAKDEREQAIKGIQIRYLRNIHAINEKAKQNFRSRLDNRLKEQGLENTEIITDYQKAANDYYMQGLQAYHKGRQAAFRSLPLSVQAGMKFYEGTIHTMASIGGALGKAGFDNAEYEIRKIADEKMRELNIPQLEREGLFDIPFWQSTIMQSAPFSAAIMIPTMGAGAIAGLAARGIAGAAGAGAQATAGAQAIAATTAAGITGYYLETKIEGGSAYNDALLRGESESQAREKADYVEKFNMAVLGTTILEMIPAFRPAKYIFKDGSTAAKFLDNTAVRYVMGMGAEAFQETLQNFAQAKAVNPNLTFDDYLKTEDAFVGAVSGGIMGTAFAIYGEASRGKKKIAADVQSGKPVMAAVEALHQNEIITDTELQNAKREIINQQQAYERFEEIENPEQRSAAAVTLAEIKTLEGQKKGDVADEAIEKQIAEKKKELSDILSGSHPFAAVYTSEGSAPEIYSESDLESLVKNPVFAQMFMEGGARISFNNIESGKYVETLKQTYDAVQKQSAGQVPVQPEAAVSEKVEEGTPEAEPQEAAQEQGVDKQEAGLKEEEQKEAVTEETKTEQAAESAEPVEPVSEPTKIVSEPVEPVSEPSVPDSKPSVPDALKDVESTAKALEGVGVGKTSEIARLVSKNEIKIKSTNVKNVEILLNKKGNPKKGDILNIGGTEWEVNKINKRQIWDSDKKEFVDTDGYEIQIRNSKNGETYTLRTENNNPFKGEELSIREKLSNYEKQISEAYHKAKADGSNPELVKAVEGLLGKKEEVKTEKKVEKPAEQKQEQQTEQKQETKPDQKPTIEQQVKTFGVAEKLVKPVVEVANALFSGLKKAGLVAKESVEDWLNIGKADKVDENSLDGFIEIGRAHV